MNQDLASISTPSSMAADSSTSMVASLQGRDPRRHEHRRFVDEVDENRAAVANSRYDVGAPSKSPSKNRSLSDSTPKPSPPPTMPQSSRQSKDDSFMSLNPRTPSRSHQSARGLSLQMPSKEWTISSTASRTPLSPQPDIRSNYGTPATLLPRHSRGLDFSRACTNLHHTTLAERSSPDSSPTITQKGMIIPSRRGTFGSMILESPSLITNPAWPTANSGYKTGPSSSVGSINMLESDSSSTSAEDNDMMEPDDNDYPIMATPQVFKISHSVGPGPFGGPLASPGASWSGSFSPAAANFMSYQRAKLKRKAKSRNSSSSASRHSSLASPIPASPPVRGVDSGNSSYFARDVVMRSGESRRQSLTLGTNELHISSGNDSGDEAALPVPGTPAVIRRPVTRRGNLLPKTKGFSRIRAELLEESMPVDSEARREAEIIRQVRDSDLDLERFHPGTENSSPILVPSVPPDPLARIPEDRTMTLDNVNGSSGKTPSATFSQHASRYSAGKEFWHNFDNLFRSSPPQTLAPYSSSVVGDDISMDSPSLSASSTSLASHQFPPSVEQGKDCGFSQSASLQHQAPSSTAVVAKRVNKRRRDNDLDVNSFKRRAVSPGMSVHNSPILSQSPGQRDGSLWGQPKTSREHSSGLGTTGERSGSGGHTSCFSIGQGPKRFGVHGISDTHDGLMKMSIE